MMTNFIMGKKLAADSDTKATVSSASRIAMMEFMLIRR